MSTLASRTVVGFAQLIGALALMLFAPAWTLDYWQAWVYIGVFAGSVGLITVYLWHNDPRLLERRVHAGPVAEKQKSQKLLQLLAAVIFIGFFIIASLDHRFSWSNVPHSMVILGDALVALGFIIILVVFRENTFTAATIEVADDQKVIVTGPYATLRHPMYSGALIMLFGTPMALGSWYALVMFLPMAIVIVCRLLDEEKLLAKDLPGYTEYCRRVRYRLVPSIW